MIASRLGARAWLLLLVPLVGCGGGRHGLYLWSGYEESVRHMSSPEGELDVDADIERMVSLVERSRERGVPPAPGIHAHLGYLYSLRGDLDNALAAFESEKELYPESRVFVDGLEARLRAGHERVSSGALEAGDAQETDHD